MYCRPSPLPSQHQQHGEIKEIYGFRTFVLYGSWFAAESRAPVLIFASLLFCAAAMQAEERIIKARRCEPDPSGGEVKSPLADRQLSECGASSCRGNPSADTAPECRAW